MITSCVFISNFFNHHQKPFSDEMDRITRGNYSFLATGEMDDMRREMGYSNIEYPSYVHCLHLRDKVALQKYLKIINDADVVIIGASEPIFLIRQRLRQGKLTFRYSERLFKSRLRYLKAPLYFYRGIKTRKCHLLCCSAYSLPDYRVLGLYNNRAYKWGYYPEVKVYEDVNTLVKNKEKNSILWVGRFLAWKHPEDAITVAKFLKQKGYIFKMRIVGIGILYNRLQTLIKENHLEESVFILGAKSPEEVRRLMELSQIFLFTSDRGEGWGAVLNESMNSACAVVACKDIGSAPYLIKEGENGYIYRSGDIDALCENVEKLLVRTEICTKMGVSAYKSIRDEWNAKVLAKNFQHLVSCIRQNGENQVTSGPCSNA